MRRGKGAATFALLMAAVVASVPAKAQTAQRTVEVYAAGSLRTALEDLGRAFTKESGIPVKPTFGASGLLKDRIAAGERADVFASANMAHPQALVDAGRAGAVRVFPKIPLKYSLKLL